MTGRRLPLVRTMLTMRALLMMSALFALSSASAASDLVTPERSSSIKTTIELPLQGVTLEYQTNVRLLRVLDDANANASSNANGTIGYFPFRLNCLMKPILKRLPLLGLKKLTNLSKPKSAMY